MTIRPAANGEHEDKTPDNVEGNLVGVPADRCRIRLHPIIKLPHGLIGITMELGSVSGGMTGVALTRPEMAKFAAGLAAIVKQGFPGGQKTAGFLLASKHKAGYVQQQQRRTLCEIACQGWEKPLDERRRCDAIVAAARKLVVSLQKDLDDDNFGEIDEEVYREHKALKDLLPEEEVPDAT